MSGERNALKVSFFFIFKTNQMQRILFSVEYTNHFSCFMLHAGTQRQDLEDRLKRSEQQRRAAIALMVFSFFFFFFEEVFFVLIFPKYNSLLSIATAGSGGACIAAARSGQASVKATEACADIADILPAHRRDCFTDTRTTELYIVCHACVYIKLYFQVHRFASHSRERSLRAVFVCLCNSVLTSLIEHNSSNMSFCAVFLLNTLDSFTLYFFLVKKSNIFFFQLILFLPCFCVLTLFS